MLFEPLGVDNGPHTIDMTDNLMIEEAIFSLTYPPEPHH
jgi:hypothetical protein